LGLSLQQHISNQELAVAQFADVASQPLAVLVDSAAGERSGFKQTFFANRAPTELAPQDVLFLLESDDLAGSTVRSLSFIFAWASQFEQSRVTCFVYFVVARPHSEHVRFLLVLVKDRLLEVNLIL
jgi:hypothetical protein